MKNTAAGNLPWAMPEDKPEKRFHPYGDITSSDALAAIAGFKPPAGISLLGGTPEFGQSFLLTAGTSK